MLTRSPHITPNKSLRRYDDGRAKSRKERKPKKKKKRKEKKKLKRNGLIKQKQAQVTTKGNRQQMTQFPQRQNIPGRLHLTKSKTQKWNVQLKVDMGSRRSVFNTIPPVEPGRTISQDSRGRVAFPNLSLSKVCSPVPQMYHPQYSSYHRHPVVDPSWYEKRSRG